MPPQMSTADLIPALHERYLATGQWTDERIGWLSRLGAERWGDRELLNLDGEESLSYAEFYEWVRAVAGDMLGHGVDPGDRVYVQLPNCLEAVVIQAAALRIGAIAVPVVPIYREHEMAQIIPDVAPAVIAAPTQARGRRIAEELDSILEEGGHRPKVKYIVGDSRPGWADTPARGSTPRPNLDLPDPARPDECAMIMYTSGTTSAPKGARFTSRSFVSSARMWRFGLDLTHRDVFVAAAPVAPLTGFLNAYLMPASVGGKGLVLSSWNPDRAVEIIEQQRGTQSSGAPVFLLDLVERYERGAGAEHRLSCFLAGGAGVSPSLIERAGAVGVLAYRTYGMTESMGSVTLMPKSTPLDRRAHWDGRAFEGMEIEVVDDRRTRMPVGEIGEIRVRGPQMMIGYTDVVATAAQSDDSEWFYPGDLGLLDDDGWLKCVGRTKDIIIRGGEKFASQDIENAILRHPTISDAAVAGMPDERLGERVAAFVTLKASEKWIGGDGMRAFLDEARLARQKIPVEWHVLDEMPRTASGKIRKNELITRASSGVI